MGGEDGHKGRYKGLERERGKETYIFSLLHVWTVGAVSYGKRAILFELGSLHDSKE